MQYNKDSHINNVDDVIKFFRYIVDERNVNFNPDDMFEDLILNETIKGCIVFLIYFFCPSQDILGISVNHLYK